MNMFVTGKPTHQEQKKNIIRKIGKLLRDPLGVIQRRVFSILQPYKYSSRDGYHTQKYWTDRLTKYRFDLRGVGIYGLSHDQNRQMYLDAKKVFLEACRMNNINLTDVSVLDVGCGNGFYTTALFEVGNKDYVGVDITSTLFEDLKGRFPNYEFCQLDIATQELNRSFDLIIMIDVTQHITTHDKFSFAMGNVKSHLKENGVFIVTSWLSDVEIQRSFYEVSRPIEAYKDQFPGYDFSEPMPFRDKFIFSIRK